MKEKCLKTLSEYRERWCRCHVRWKTVPEGDARNWKSPFADGGEVERRHSKWKPTGVSVKMASQRHGWSMMTDTRASISQKIWPPTFRSKMCP